jgi:hypothetical protein
MVTDQTKPILGFNGQYRFLSNFYPSKIDFEGLSYPTVEHAYQAAKTEIPYMRKAIAECPTAGDAKHAGRSLVLRDDWEDVKFPIMKTLLRKKFYDVGLRGLLVETGEAELVETNYWHDNIWGSCSCLRCVAKTGDNYLGKYLMELRAEFNGQA